MLPSNTHITMVLSIPEKDLKCPYKQYVEC